MKTKLISAILTAGMTLCFATSASAQDINMYINNQFVVRDMQTVSDFDMLPVLDIAGELGFNCYFDGYTIELYNDHKSFTFTMGSASVYDESGRWYGLDIVPQIINGKVRVPAKFFQDALGMSYVWDEVTNTIFMGSESTYEWLVNTYEYQEAAIKYNQISYDEALDLVRNYFISRGETAPSFYMYDGETNNEFTIRAYDDVYHDGEYSHSFTRGIISVDKNTGALYDEVFDRYL